MCSTANSPIYHVVTSECTSLHSLWLGIREDRGGDRVTRCDNDPSQVSAEKERSEGRGLGCLEGLLVVGV